jgi:hypothetical protein
MFVEPLADKKFQVLFRLTFSIIGKDITMFEYSQTFLACPSDNSYTYSFGGKHGQGKAVIIAEPSVSVLLFPAGNPKGLAWKRNQFSAFEDQT